MVIIKNNLIFLGVYVLISIISVFIISILNTTLERNYNFAFVAVVVLILAILFSCFISGKLLGYNAGSKMTNFMSTISIIVVIAVSILLAMIDINSFLFTAMFKVFIGPIFYITKFISITLSINPTICLITLLLLPYAAFTTGAVMKQSEAD